MGALDWMARRLRAAGITVVEYRGWRSRRAPGRFAPRAVMWHHDASAPGPSPGMPRLIAEVGNSSTPPPLAHVWVDRRGRWHLTASGRANHAGTGRGWGVIPANSGNTYSIGIETDHTVGERWPPDQRRALRLGTAVLLKHLGVRPRNALCGHKEYAPGRKIDPAGMNLAVERRRVAELMKHPPDPTPPPEEDDEMKPILVRIKDTKPVYVGNFITYRHVRDEAELGHLKARLGDVQVWNPGTLGVLGVEIKES